MTSYIGSGAYCYANSTSMLLAAAGEQVAPGLIEVLTGVGLGAEKHAGNAPIWFNNLTAEPDVGISKALTILGFEYTERSYDDDAEAPFAELGAALEHGPVILGPLNMGFLRYVPSHTYLDGVDHFVLAYAIDDQRVYLHDPAGYPHVSLPLADLARAWHADRIGYRRGAYRSWTALKQIERPDDQQIYQRAMRWFAESYRTTRDFVEGTKGAKLFGADAIQQFATTVREGTLSDETRGHLVHFALQLGARRALDFAAFFAPHDAELASKKQQQARLFGQAHTQIVAQDLTGLADTLEQLAEVEDTFETALLVRVLEPTPELVSA